MFLPNADYEFFGPTVSVTVGNGQRIFGGVTGMLGTTTNALFFFGLCFQPPGDFLYNFSAVELSAELNAATAPISVTAATGQLLAGTYEVGMCVRVLGAGSLNRNGYVNGAVQVTN